MTTENVADMTAWLPTIAARVATQKTGQKTGSALHKKETYGSSALDFLTRQIPTNSFCSGGWGDEEN